MQSTRIRDYCKILGSSPIHAISRGNHELFHSDFLAWLLQNYPNSLTILKIPANVKHIEREKIILILVSKMTTVVSIFVN
ncbi:hypothetical protein SAMN04515695_5809 [Pseudovibrio sp. Tun.PSC04-5.I4]|nr:hypothetical protein SAMN04515695_5809 [Pseudovibrio sp. Tun.PSC04-5.I4]